jgi:hypothetical protein
MRAETVATAARTSSLTLIALGAGLACGGALAQSFPSYTLQPLPQLTAFTALNDQGRILGKAIPPCPPGQICSTVDAPVLLDTASGTLTFLSSDYGALNGNGQLAGASIQRDAGGNIVRSVLVRQPDGTVSSGPPPAIAPDPGYPLRARGLTNAGSIALQLSDGLDAVLARSCTPYPGWIGSLGGAWTALGGGSLQVSLSGSNAAGRVAGAGVPVSLCATRDFRALVASPDGSWVDLHGTYPGPSSRAFAINDRDYAAGEVNTGTLDASGRPIMHAMVWNSLAGVAFDMSPSAGVTSRLSGMNARGEVVGRTGADATTARAVIGNHAISSALFDLNSFVLNNTDVLTEALAINAAGQIVARGTSPGSSYVLLTPTQTPTDPYATVPAAPTALAVQALSSTQVRLNWTNVARNATGLQVERCKGSKCQSFARIASLPGDVATFLDTTVSRSTAYRYRVRATNPAGPSAYTPPVSVTTPR